MAAKKKRVRTKPAKAIYVITDNSLVGDDLHIQSLMGERRMSEDMKDVTNLATDILHDFEGEISYQTEKLEKSKDPTAFFYSLADRKRQRDDAEKSLAIAKKGKNTITIIVYKPVKTIVYKGPKKAKKATKRKA